MSGPYIQVEVDGRQAPGPGLLSSLKLACDQAESTGEPVLLQVSGTPAADWTTGLDIALVTRWEKALRRLEQLPSVTLATAHADCGGPALDALLVTDLRVATAGTRLMVARSAAGTWPSAAVHRLVQQAGAGPMRAAVLFGVPITTVRAMELGLIHELTSTPGSVPAGIGRLADLDSGREVSIRRRLLLDAVSTGFEEALGAHLAAGDRSLRWAPA